MDKYTIYCTEEQTKKALELGAPVRQEYIGRCITEGLPRVGCNTEEDVKDYLCPTAEQMIGWLEEQGMFVQVIKPYNNADLWLYYVRPADRHRANFNSRKEATLAAIDMALDYLDESEE